MKKQKVVLEEMNEFKNKNYKLLIESYPSIALFEKDIPFRFMEIRINRIEPFHFKNILKRFGFEVVKNYTVVNNETEFLNFFKGLNVGIIKDTNGKNIFVGLLGKDTYSEEYLEEKHKVIINF